MKKRLLIALIVITVVCIAIAVWFALKDGSRKQIKDYDVRLIRNAVPEMGEVYAAQPINVTINTSSEATADTTLSVKDAEGNEWTEGELRLIEGAMSLQKDLRQGMPDGDYDVVASICANDSCGQYDYSFSVQSDLQEDYADLRGREEVEIAMEGLVFSPRRVMVSPGASVKWTNKDSIPHFINTESREVHTYYPQQNSSIIEAGDSFSTVFVLSGQYKYHCQDHIEQEMQGSILVLD